MAKIKDQVQSKIDEVQSDVQAKVEEVQNTIQSKIDEVEAEIQTVVDDVQSKIDEVEAEVTSTIDNVVQTVKNSVEWVKTAFQTAGVTPKNIIAVGKVVAGSKEVTADPITVPVFRSLVTVSVSEKPSTDALIDVIDNVVVS